MLCRQITMSDNLLYRIKTHELQHGPPLHNTPKTVTHSQHNLNKGTFQENSGASSLTNPEDNK